MKNLLLIWFSLISFVSSTQITLFSETFEGATQSLTLVNGTQTNKWFFGSANQCNGVKALYISNNASAYSYTNTSTSIAHAYFDIAVPSGATNITLNFNRKVAGEASYDDLRVWSCVNTTSPSAGTAVTASGTNRVLLGTIQGQTTCATTTYTLPNTIAGTTRRIIFSWRNDATGGVNPPALIDNITVTYTVATPPSNDACSGATNLPCGTSNLAGTTVNAVSETAPNASTTGTMGVWYKFTGDGQQTTITVVQNLDTRLLVLTSSTGACGGVYTTVANVDLVTSSNETATFTATNGTVYYVYIGYYTSGAITGTFSISRTCVTVPSNNNCSSAPALTINTGTTCTTSTNGTTVGATQSSAACTGTADDDVWYSFVASATSQTITVTPGTLVDAVLQVYSGTCAGLTSLACVDATAGSSTETTTVSGLTIGITYYVRVHSYGNGTGQGTFSICATTPCTTPTTAGTLSANKTNTTVNDAVIFTTTGNAGTITLLEWSFNNFTTVAGSTANPVNPYTLILNIQQPTMWFRTTSVSGTCPAGTTPAIAVTLASAPAYVYGTEDGDYISNITLNTINNNSTFDPPLGDSYQNFTNLSTSLVAGSTYTISASSPVTFAGRASGYAAWVDFNNNGVFETSENIMLQPYGATMSQSFTVPNNASVGTVLMRVLSVWGETPLNDAYYAVGYNFGEIEEYSIIIVAPLPIELSKFDGFNKGENNHLFWSTSSEHNTSHFELQKSRDGENWTTIATLNAAGNSTDNIDYSVTDYNVDPTINYYRLKQHDNDGVYEIFGPIVIDNTNLKTTKVIVKYINLRGQEIDPSQFTSTGVYIEVYDDGTMKRVYR